MDVDETIVITGADRIAHFAMCQCIGRLRIETSTGMTFRESTLKAVQRVYGIKSRTKVKALAELEDLYEKLYGRRYGS